MGVFFSSNNCGECKFLDMNDSKYGDYYCSIDHKYYSTSRLACDRDFQKRETQSSGNCYITTAVCNLIGYSDNCFILNKLRDFRDNKMKHDVDCYTMLREYDVVGPEIVKSMHIDPNKKLVAISMLTNYIIPAVNDIVNGDDDKAIDSYVAMTQTLKDYYGISKSFDEKDVDQEVNAFVRNKELNYN